MNLALFFACASIATQKSCRNIGALCMETSNLTIEKLVDAARSLAMDTIAWFGA